MVKKNLNAEIILEKTLEMIIRYEGAAQLNLRKIAKELKCAHTNIYNYYGSYDDLLWRTTGVAMKQLSEYMFRKNTVEGFVRDYVEFAFKNKGLYKLIWYERINSKMPEEVMEIVKYPGLKAAEIYAGEFELKLEEAQDIVGIGLAYAHGELTIYLNDRALIPEEYTESYKEKIVKNALNILFNYQISTGGNG